MPCRGRMTPACRDELLPPSLTPPGIPAPPRCTSRLRAIGSSSFSRLCRFAGARRIANEPVELQFVGRRAEILEQPAPSRRLDECLREQVHAFDLARPGLRVVLPVGQR